MENNIPKVTIEKRIIKINGTEDFVLEYPSNYDDIVNKKLQNLDKEYDESQIDSEQNDNNNFNNINTNKDELEKKEEANNDIDINEKQNENECYNALEEEHENNNDNNINDINNDNENNNENGNNNNDEINHEIKNDVNNLNDDDDMEGFQAVTIVGGGGEKKQEKNEPNKNDKEEDEEEEEESQSKSHSYQLDTIQTNSLWSNKPDSQIGDSKSEKSSSSTRTIEKKPNPFQVYNSREFNIFHPGGKVPLYRKIKEEIQDIEKLSQPKPNIVCKFKIKKKNKNLRKKRKREKVLRKCKPDNIRKKIKSRFFKSVKNRINQILRNAKSKELFDLLPQCFIINITKKKNQPIMKMTFKNLVTYDFITEEQKEMKNESDFIKKKRIVDIKKYNKNLKVMEYLNKNADIVQKSKFDIIGNMTVTQMFNEYLKSDEFEKEVLKLEEEGDSISYIKDYISKAFGFINYFH